MRKKECLIEKSQSDIYDFLPYSEEEKKRLKQTELETELLNCVPDLTMQRLFHQFVERHKQNVKSIRD